MNNAERLPDLKQISVMVPVKNEEASIRQLLQGLSAQTCQPAEIVITDGGSTDRTKEIIREHRLSTPISIVLVETEEALPGRGEISRLRERLTNGLQVLMPASDRTPIGSLNWLPRRDAHLMRRWYTALLCR